MHGIELGGGGGSAPCPVPAGTCSEILTYNETCQWNFHMVPNTVKSFGYFPDYFLYGKALMIIFTP